MPFIGNIVNTAAVVVGALIGMAFKRGVSQNMERALMQAMGLCTMFIGIMGTVTRMLRVQTGEGGAIAVSFDGTMLLIGSLVIGTFVGQLIDIEDKIEKLGDWLRNKVTKSAAEDGTEESAQKGMSRFTEGFMASTLIICVGAMAVVGGIEDGMGHPETLLAKSILDCVIVLILASTMGVGVAFSALPLFVYQGIFCLIGFAAGNVMTDAMASDLSMVGNVLIFGVGINLMLGTFSGSNRVHVGNMLPALLVPLAYEAILPLLGM